MSRDRIGAPVSPQQAVDQRLFGLSFAPSSVTQGARDIEIIAAADASVIASGLISQLGAWVERLGPPFSPALVPSCSLFAACVSPWLDAPASGLVAKTGAWIAAFDALADELHDPADEAFAATMRRCLAVVRGDRDGSAPAVVAALAELDEAVAASQPDGVLREWWHEATTRLLVGMAFERDTSRALILGASGSPLQDYLRHATYTIGLPMLTIAMWSGVPGLELHDRSAFHRVLEDAGLVVRLANDLRGHDRERAEGVVDAITLGMAADDLSDLLIETLERCRSRLATLVAESADAAVSLERQLLWMLRCYQRYDIAHA
jgi:hypothetical protein